MYIRISLLRRSEHNKILSSKVFFEYCGRDYSQVNGIAPEDSNHLVDFLVSKDPQLLRERYGSS